MAHMSLMAATRRRAAATTSLVRQNAVHSASGVSSFAVTLPSVGAGHALIMALSAYGSSPVAASSITDSASNTWTHVVAKTTNTSAPGMDLWYVASSAASASTLTATVNYSGTPAYGANLTEWSQSLTLHASNTGTGSSVSGSQSLSVTSTSGDLVIAAMGNSADDNPSVVSPATQLTATTDATGVNLDPGYVLATSTTASLAWAAFPSAESFNNLIASFTH